MYSREEFEFMIEEFSNKEYCVFNTVIETLCKHLDVNVKKQRSLLMKEKSPYVHYYKGYLNGKKVTQMSVIYSSRKILKRILKQIEEASDGDLTTEEKLDLIDEIQEIYKHK